MNKLNMKNTYSIKRVIVSIILLFSFFAIAGLSLAIFIDRKSNRIEVSLGQVALGDNTNVGTTINGLNIVAGETIFNDTANPISFVRDANSKSMYVRAKISWAIPSSVTTDVRNAMAPIITDLRQNTKYTIYSPTNTNAMWTQTNTNIAGENKNLISNYINLTDTTGQFYAVDETDNNVYNLISKIQLPLSLQNIENQSIMNLDIEFQAIQSEKLEAKTNEEITNIFNSKFPEKAEENFNEPFELTYTIVNTDSAKGTSSFSSTESITTKTFSVGEVITIYGTKLAGNVFLGYTENSSNDLITNSNELEYTFIAQANYEGYSYYSYYTYIPNTVVGVNDESMGSVAVTGNTGPTNEIFYGDTATLTAYSNTGYIFSRWSYSVDGIAITAQNPYTFTKDRNSQSTIYAIFVEDIPSNRGETQPTSSDYGNWEQDLPQNISKSTLQNSQVNIHSQVYAIGNSAFSGCTSLTMIVIPEGVTSIGAYCFSACTNLATIILPSSLTYIDNNAFYNCNALTNITINGTQVITFKSSTNPLTTFSGAAATNVDMDGTVLSTVDYLNRSTIEYYTDTTNPGGTTTTGKFTYTQNVGNYARTYTYNKYNTESTDHSVITYDDAGQYIELVSVNTNEPSNVDLTIPLTIKGKYVTRSYNGTYNKNFSKIISSKLKTVNTCNIIHIGNYSFYSCLNLMSIKILEATSIGVSSFGKCFKLVQIHAKSSFNNYEKIESVNNPYMEFSATGNFEGTIDLDSNGVIIYTKDSHKSLLGYDGSEKYLDLTGYEFDEVYQYALYNNKTLNTIKLPNQCTQVSNSAFYTTDLTSVSMPGVINIGENTFYYCINLNVIFVNANLSQVGTDAFLYSYSMSEVYYYDPTSTISAGFSGFAYTSYFIKDYGIDTISGYEYYVNFDNEIIISSHINKNIDNLVVPETVYWNNAECDVISIKAAAFREYLTLVTVNLPSSVIKIGGGAFYGCSNLTSVNSPQVQIIEIEAFSNCSRLNSVNIPQIESVGMYAFDRCISLKEISMPKVSTISNSAFNACNDLLYVSMPLVTSIGLSAFSNCSKLVQVHSNSNFLDNTSINSPNNEDMEFSSTGVFSGTIEVDENGVQLYTYDVNKYVIGYFGNETRLDLSNYDFNKIYSYAFNSYTNLKSIVLPTSCVSIGEGSFYMCENLVSAIMLGVENMGRYAFYYCYKISSMVLDAGIGTVNTGAFTNSGQPSEIYYFDATATANTDNSGLRGTKYYIKAYGIDTVSGLNYYVSYDNEIFIYGINNSNMTTLVIPSTIIWNGEVCAVKYIAAGAFRSETNLTSITIPSSVTGIGAYAFNGLTNITNKVSSLDGTWVKTIGGAVVKGTVLLNGLTYSIRKR